MKAIALYVGRHDPAAAVRLLRRVDALLDLLAENPRLGPARPDIGADLRSFNVPPYMLLYQPISGGIRLVRVLHGARDLSRKINDR